MNGSVIRIISACALRQAAKSMFDELPPEEIAVRDEPWIDQDSYDAGLLTAAKYLLSRADMLETDLEAEA